MAVDSAGDVIVSGSSVGKGGKPEIYTAKHAGANGSLLWEMRKDVTGEEGSGLDIAEDSAGSIFVVAYTSSGSLSNYYLLKYTPVDLDGDTDGLPDSWEIAHFGGTEGQGALDDTDGDGAVELLELAFGTDPRSGNSVPAQAVVVEGGYLTTKIAKRPGVGYLVETGALLESDFSSASTTVLTDDATTLKIRGNVPADTQPARFLRVRVTAAP